MVNPAGVQTLRHVGIVVADVERSLAFYRDLLGLMIVRQDEESGPFLETILAMPQARVQTVKLAFSGGGGLVELLQFRVPESRPASHDLVRRGITHLAITVDHLDDLYEKLRARNIPWLSAPQISPNGAAKVAFTQDPDGNLIECVENLSTP